MIHGLNGGARCAIMVMLLSLAVVSLLSCGGTPLKTFTAAGTIGGDNRRLMALLHHGSVSVRGVAGAGSTVNATLVVKDRGLIGLLSSHGTSPDNYQLKVADSGTSITIVTGTDANSMEYDFDLSVTVPKDYYFYCSNLQEPSRINTTGGSVTVSDLSGNGFEIWSEAALNGDEFPMTVKNVAGFLQANSSGKLTISGCPGVMLAATTDKLDLTLTARPGRLLPMLSGTDGVTIRVPAGLDISFLQEYADRSKVILDASGRFLGRRTIDGLYDWWEVYCGSGTPAGGAGIALDYAYQVSSLAGSISYLAAP